VRALIAEPLTAAAFAPFGTVVAWPGGDGRAINAGSSRRADLDDALQLVAQDGAPRLAIYRAEARTFPFTAKQLERHKLGSQTFIPLGAARFVILVAPAGAKPQADSLRAFVTDGRQGVSLAPGTWHHGLLALDAADFAVIERAAPEEDCELATLDQPVAIAPG
jgi:ureidoglycolate lyase